MTTATVQRLGTCRCDSWADEETANLEGLYPPDYEEGLAEQNGGLLQQRDITEEKEYGESKGDWIGDSSGLQVEC